MIVTYDIMTGHMILEGFGVLWQPSTKRIVILSKIWCEKLMSITLHLTCVILPHGINMQSNSHNCN
jgi:hypothetical protein